MYVNVLLTAQAGPPLDEAKELKKERKKERKKDRKKERKKERKTK